MRTSIISKLENTKDGPQWVCQTEGCRYASPFMSVAIFHHHVEHNIPMEDVKLKENNILVWEDKESN
jgi:hypothetical protein